MAAATCQIYVLLASFCAQFRSSMPNIHPDIQILFRFTVQQVRVVYMLHFSMMVQSSIWNAAFICTLHLYWTLCHFSNTWTLINIRILRLYIFVHAVYVFAPVHLWNLICQKRVDFYVGRFPPLLEFLTPGQAASDHVYSTFQQPLVSLSPGYLTSLTIGQALGQLHGMDTSLFWSALCRAHTTQYPPA
jgi:hypothetical protein